MADERSLQWLKDINISEQPAVLIFRGDLPVLSKLHIGTRQFKVGTCLWKYIESLFYPEDRKRNLIQKFSTPQFRNHEIYEQFYLDCYAAGTLLNTA